MDLSAIIKAVAASRTESGGQNTLNLQPGDQLTGRVLQLENDGRVLIDLGGSRVLAQVGFPVKQGQSLRLTVIESGPQLHMRSEPPGARPELPLAPQADPSAALKVGERRELIQTLQGIIPRLPGQAMPGGMTEPVVHALRQLHALLGPLPLEKPTQEIAQWLRNAMENHGSLFEKRLADAETSAPAARPDSASTSDRQARALVRAVITSDLKPQLLVLKQALAGGDTARPLADIVDGKEAALLRTGVEKMLSHVEQQQAQAITRARDGEPLQLIQHLVALAEDQAPAQLKVYYPRRKKGSGATAAHRIALLLDMDRLGMVRGDIAMMNDALQVCFYVQDETVRDHFRAHLKEISTALSAGIEHVRVEVLVSREKIARFQAEDARESAAGRIDIQA